MVWVDERLQLLDPISAGALTLYVVVDAEGAAVPPVEGKLLSEALRDGTVRVTEVGEGGVVPELFVQNIGDVDVFAFAGDVVTGGKQDRILTEDVVLRPSAEPQRLSVNCVEAGRWHAGGLGTAFRSAGRAEPELTREVQTARDQGTTWRKVDELLHRRRQASPTSTYTRTMSDPDTGAAVERTLSEVERPTAHPGAVGVIAAIGGHIESAEIYDAPALFRRARPSLLRSLILGAVGRAPQSAPAPSADQAAAWLREARAARERRTTAHEASSYVETESETTTNFELRGRDGRRVKGSYYNKK